MLRLKDADGINTVSCIFKMASNCYNNLILNSSQQLDLNIGLPLPPSN